MSEELPPLETSFGYDRDSTIEKVAYLIAGFLTNEIRQGKMRRYSESVSDDVNISEQIVDAVFMEVSKDIYAITQELGQTTKALAATRTRLQDAEITISKIGFCDPAPYEAMMRYENKYGPLKDMEHKVVKP